jgi:peroxin-1
MTSIGAAMKEYVPSSTAHTGTIQTLKTWRDIGGMNDIKRVLRETLAWPAKYSHLFAQCGMKLQPGYIPHILINPLSVLLYGPPGCRNTLMASSVANECGLNLISVKGPEILNKYIGASEQAIRDIFDRASAAKPCVLFFDEFEAVAPKRFVSYLFVGD